jgi:Raf kinase inhibitor-like YbhB/YbcL family protein
MRFNRSSRSIVVPVILLAVSAGISAQQRGGGGRGGGGRGRGNAFANLTLVTTAWPDGGMIPLRYTQAGPEISPAIQWSAPPAGTASFVLMFHDADALAANNSTDDFLHWMLWNIPATATGLPQGMADGFELPDGTRQISVSGSRYRGPGASATGPIHHYVLELYALDTMLDIKVNPQGPQEPNPNAQAIRTSIVQAMAGHIRGKAAYFGLFRRPQ